MVTDWNNHIEEGYSEEPKHRVIPAVKGKYQIVFINCATLEQAMVFRERFFGEWDLSASG